MRTRRMISALVANATRVPGNPIHPCVDPMMDPKKKLVLFELVVQGINYWCRRYFFSDSRQSVEDGVLHL